MTRKRLIAGFKTQKELANYLGIQQTTISEWETFKNYPKKEEIIKAVEKALNCEIIEIFPPEFIRAIEKKIGIPLERVVDMKELPPFTRGELLLPSPEKAFEMKEMRKGIENAFRTLTQREAKILILKFGLNGHHEHGVSEIAKIYKVGRARIHQIVTKALWKLKHPSRVSIIKDPNYPERTKTIMTIYGFKEVRSHPDFPDKI